MTHTSPITDQPLGDDHTPAVADLLSDLKRLEQRLDTVSRQLEQLKADQPTDRVTIVAFSGDLDKLMSAFIVANGAAAMGSQVSVFFTFWGLAAIKKATVYQRKSWLEKMFAFMLPSGPQQTGLSKMNMFGLGPVFLKTIMKKNNVASIPELIDLSKEMGVRLIACQMSMGVMGISREEIIDGVEFGGVGLYLGHATDSRVTLFI